MCSNKYQPTELCVSSNIHQLNYVLHQISNRLMCCIKYPTELCVASNIHLLNYVLHQISTNSIMCCIKYPPTQLCVASNIHQLNYVLYQYPATEFVLHQISNYTCRVVSHVQPFLLFCITYPATSAVLIKYLAV